MRQKLRIIVTGLIGQYPMGGVSWDYFQYVLGLKLLGHDVYYLEDTGFWPYNPTENGLSNVGCDYNIQYLERLFKSYGLENNWMYKFCGDGVNSLWFGLPDFKRKEIIKSADIIINVSGCLYDPSQYAGHAKLVYIDSDPVFTQVKLALGYESFDKQIALHDRLFTFAENSENEIPKTKYSWYATRQPIVLSEWDSDVPIRNVFSTIMNWTSYASLIYQDQEYGQKDLEFEAYLKLPNELKVSNLTPRAELAVNQGKTSKTPYEKLLKNDWLLVDPNSKCHDMNSYRSYIQSSMAEWSIAKHGYVQGKSGWFSCRSACYLAAGRPVIVQDTGFSNVIECGSGIHAFNSMDDVIDAVERVSSNYDIESTRARELASTYFHSNLVLSQLIDDVFVNESSISPVLPAVITDTGWCDDLKAVNRYG